MKTQTAILNEVAMNPPNSILRLIKKTWKIATTQRVQSEQHNATNTRNASSNAG